MGWWKCSRNINLQDVSLELRKISGRGDTKAGDRMFIFYSLLSETSEGIIFSSVQSFQDIVWNTPTQCQIVWDICQKHNVLRKDGNGYSAREWMLEQGLLPDEPKQITQSSQPEPEQPKRQYEVKEQVRPNVRLSRKEIEELKKDYSDDQIARMLDKLSEYKTNNGRNYASDYQAIRKWVYKTLDEKPKEKPVPDGVIEFPDWIFGIKEGTNDQG